MARRLVRRTVECCCRAIIAPATTRTRGVWMRRCSKRCSRGPWNSDALEIVEVGALGRDRERGHDRREYIFRYLLAGGLVGVDRGPLFDEQEPVRTFAVSHQLDSFTAIEG